MKKILVVDDENSITDACVQLLETKNYKADTARSVKEAKEKLKNVEFDIVISDVFLQGETGMVLLRYIRENYPDTGVIMMTGNPEVSEAECRREGAFDYISKPFEAKEFLNKVNVFFKV